jgi:hypothetical protein
MTSFLKCDICKHEILKGEQRILYAHFDEYDRLLKQKDICCGCFKTISFKTKQKRKNNK